MLDASLDTMLDTTAVPVWAPVLICLFGRFRLLSCGASIPVRAGGKTETLLACLALRSQSGMRRDALLEAVWPESDLVRARQSLTTLVSSLRKLLGGPLSGASPVLYGEGSYVLNSAAGVMVDVPQFEALAAEGDRALMASNVPSAMRSWMQAVSMYRGDICLGSDVYSIVERERLRALQLTLLARLADQCLREGKAQEALHYACHLLRHDPCREDAHRLVMRCHVRLGERAQALRQYRVCRDVLEREFGAPPEPSTEALLARIRFDPASL
jgi:DNA-binding SARP family transcriptional activator